MDPSTGQQFKARGLHEIQCTPRRRISVQLPRESLPNTTTPTAREVGWINDGRVLSGIDVLSTIQDSKAQYRYAELQHLFRDTNPGGFQQTFDLPAFHPAVDDVFRIVHAKLRVRSTSLARIR